MRLLALDRRPLDRGPLDGPPGAAAPPYDLAAAIVTLFDATPALSGSFTRIYRDQAGDRAVLPYLVYTLRRGDLARKSTTSSWHDDRATFRAWAATGQQANSLAEAIRGVFEPDGNGITLSFQVGVTTPFYEVDRGQGKGKGRGPNAAYEFFAEVHYGTRTRSGRPS